MQTHLNRFKDLGANVVALCPQRHEFNQSISTELKLGFPVVRDSDNKVATAFGLTIQTSPEVIEAERFLGLDLPAHNDSDHWNLPIPSRYVLNKTGKIHFAALHVDHRFRTDPQECLKSMLGDT